MSPTLCALAASLLVGQTQEATIVSGVTSEGATQRVWTEVPAPRTGWASGMGWGWRSAPTAEERPVLSRISDRLSHLFGNRQQAARASGPSQGMGWIEAGSQGNVQTAPPQTGLPIIRNHSDEPRAKTVVWSEPPLLDMFAGQGGMLPAHSVAARPVSLLPGVSPLLDPAGTGNRIGAELAVLVGHAPDYSDITGQLEITNGIYLIHYGVPGANDRFGGRLLVGGDVDLSSFQNGDLVTVRGSVLAGRSVSIFRADTIELMVRETK